MIDSVNYQGIVKQNTGAFMNFHVLIGGFAVSTLIAKYHEYTGYTESGFAAAAFVLLVIAMATKMDNLPSKRV
jgi:hypothetical protein